MPDKTSTRHPLHKRGYRCCMYVVTDEGIGSTAVRTVGREKENVVPPFTTL